MTKNKDTSWESLLTPSTPSSKKEKEYSDFYESWGLSAPKTELDSHSDFLDKTNEDLSIEFDEDFEDEDDELEVSDLTSESYYNFGDSIAIKNYDVQKWMNTLKNIFELESNGLSRNDAMKKITSSWKENEVINFQNWIKFYQSRSHLKYSLAKNWYQGDAPGYYLPIEEKKEVLKASDPMEELRAQVASSMSEKDRKDIIERQRSKLIGRLDSVEKLLRSHEGQMFSGAEFEKLLDCIYDLKRKIQLVNKLSVSTKIYDDMIIREANILKRDGFKKASHVLYKLAQEAITPASPPPPTDSVGTPGDLPSPMPIPGNGAVPGEGPTTPNIPDMAEDPSAQSPDMATPAEEDGMSEFLKNLNVDIDDSSKADDLVIVEDELHVEDRDGILISEGQEVVAPAVPAKATVPDASKTEPGPIKEPAKTEISVEDLINAALGNVTAEQVITKLEDVAKILSTREIPRQLYFVDLMLNKMGIASLFPMLGEATNKAIDSNNYMQSRIDDMISKLRGTIKNDNIDLREGSSNEAESALKTDLLEQNRKEKARKQLKKDLSNKELDSVMNPEAEEKETPEVELEQDLAPGPVAPAPAPVKPAV